MKLHIPRFHISAVIKELGKATIILKMFSVRGTHKTNDVGSIFRPQEDTTLDTSYFSTITHFTTIVLKRPKGFCPLTINK